MSALSKTNLLLEKPRKINILIFSFWKYKISNWVIATTFMILFYVPWLENRKWLHKPGNGIEKYFLDDWVPILGRFKRIFSSIEVHLNLIFRPPKKEGRDLIHKKYGFSSHRSSKGTFPSSCGMTHDLIHLKMLSKVKI